MNAAIASVSTQATMLVSRAEPKPVRFRCSICLNGGGRRIAGVACRNRAQNRLLPYGLFEKRVGDKPDDIFLVAIRHHEILERTTIGALNALAIRS